jgi:hypothetical protein
MINYKTTITQVTVHKADESAVFGESATRIKLEDEGAGGYLVIEQDESSIRLDPEELDLIIAEAKKLMAQFQDEN